MASFSGSALYIEWVYSGGTVNLSGDFRTLDHADNVQLIDGSAGADVFREWVSGMRDGDLSLQAVYQSGGTALWTSIAPNTVGTINYGPQGSALLSEKVVVPAIVQSRSRNQPYSDIVSINVTWKQTANLTQGAW